MKNFVVVGSGLAGLSTALFLKKIFIGSNVTVIGSKEIGILGAGEGTVPSFKEFLRAIDIDPNEMIKHCKATLKYGIKFDNWDKNGKGTYYNGFRSSSAIDPEYSSFKLKWNIIDLYCYVNDIDPHKYSILMSHLNNNKVLYEQNEKGDVHQKMHRAIFHAYHFDAHDIANFLEKIALERGVNYIDDVVTEFVQDSDGYITNIKTKHTEVSADFVFDCTGFKRLIIGKLFNSNFVEPNDRLLVNRSIPFILPPKDSIEPYTTATAMKNGWCWKIPLQHRYGCGYVFNDNFCSIEDAKKEIIEKFGEVEMPRTISFKAGYYDEVWKKNCIAVGLSGAFVEPLEATSIWLSLSMLMQVTKFLYGIEYRDQNVIDLYNKMYTEANEIIIDNIQLHYLNGRSDTEFWRAINSSRRSEKLNELCQIWKSFIPATVNEESMIYPKSHLLWESSWFQIAIGVGFIDKDFARKSLDIYKPYYSNVFDASFNMENALKIDINRSMSHSDYIKHLVGEEKYNSIKSSIFPI